MPWADKAYFLSLNAGYGGRIMMHANAYELNGFLLQICCISLAPAFFSAAIYFCLSRMYVLPSSTIISVWRAFFFPKAKGKAELSFMASHSLDLKPKTTLTSSYSAMLSPSLYKVCTFTIYLPPIPPPPPHYSYR